LIPYEKVANLLKEVLPVSGSTNQETVREHLHIVAERMEAELGEERQPDPVKPEVDPKLLLSDGPMTVGLDDGYVRAADKEGFFEVIVGRSVVAFRRQEEDAVPTPKCFGFQQGQTPPSVQLPPQPWDQEAVAALCRPTIPSHGDDSGS